MKKLFIIGLFLSLFCAKGYSLDTLRLCEAISGHSVCNGLLGYVSFNGVSVSEPGTIFPAGTEGVATAHCVTSGMWSVGYDTSFYVIIYGKPKICAITSDSNNHSVIYIDSSWLPGIASITVKRKATTNSWQTVGTINPGDSLVFTDITANTASQQYTYKLEGGFCSEGNQITTIHLQANGNNLSWNGADPNLRGYYIYKRNSLGSFSLIDSTASLTYTDPNFQNGDEYFIGMFNDNGCQSTAWRSAKTPLFIKSNRLTVNISGIDKTKVIVNKYYVSSNVLNVMLNKASDIYIRDVLGREIVHEYSSNLSLPLTSGLYIMNVGARGFKVLIP
ncbi:MAG: hypothetical protein KF706_02440 [Chitinophagales bacterium]|nr:hypothetical protein [Chitinophagales bacterium]